MLALPISQADQQLGCALVPSHVGGNLRVAVAAPQGTANSPYDSSLRYRLNPHPQKHFDGLDAYAKTRARVGYNTRLVQRLLLPQEKVHYLSVRHRFTALTMNSPPHLLKEPATVENYREYFCRQPCCIY